MTTTFKGTAFQFVDGGRKYTCRVAAFGSAAAPWWWVEVSGDASRYAPFRASDADTEDSVRARVVAYYEGHLERRAAPSSHWGSRRGGNGQTTAAAPAPRTADAAAT